MTYRIFIKPQNLTIESSGNCTLLELLQQSGLHPDAPCGGKGTCGKCRVLVDGKEALSCQTTVDRDMTVTLPQKRQAQILTSSAEESLATDGRHRYALAYDIGTTTVVAFLLDGINGKTLAKASCINPQAQYGADVISRIQYAMEEDADALKNAIRGALRELCIQACSSAGIHPEEITSAAIVGNTAMHHLLLGIDPRPLTVPPYMPNIYHALELPAEELLPIRKNGTVRILPNIAGFVGADTVGCLVATEFDRLTETTLMIDIGTNGEMVLGNGDKRIACSTAAGPAFEGAKIRCGMRGAEGAIDHVFYEDGKISWHVIGDCEPVGLCGSGLLDLVAVLLKAEIIDEMGKLQCGDQYDLEGTKVFITQKDIREVQLAKSAIRAGIELMSKKLGITVESIRQVLLAGAFGSYMDPASACAIGMIPPILQDRIRPIGNAAGEGARHCAVSADQFAYSSALAKDTEFLELASMPEFNDCYIDYLCFEEE